MIVPLMRRPYVLAVPFLLTGCATPALQLPAELAPAERLDVEGMSRVRTPDELRFGVYRATSIDRSWTKGGGWSVVGLKQNSARQTYGFRFVDGDVEQGAVACESKAQRRGLDLEVVEIDPGADVSLTCSLGAGGHGGAGAEAGTGAPAEAPAWLLSLSSTRDRHLEGEISTAGRRYGVRASGRGGKLVPAETHGFHLLSDGRVVAAVQTNTRGTVWFSPDLDAAARRDLALGAMALLLYQEPPTDS